MHSFLTQGRYAAIRIVRLGLIDLSGMGNECGVGGGLGLGLAVQGLGLGTSMSGKYASACPEDSASLK